MTLGSITYRITIGSQSLKGFASVSINSSVEAISDVATIELPAYINNQTYDIEAQVKRGMPCEIWLGYENENQLEFKGFVRAISVNTPCVIELEDEMFAFRKQVKSEVFLNKSVSDIIKSVATQIGYPVESKVDDLKYDKFVVNEATGYEVLQKIQEQFRIAIYMYQGKLYANYLFLERKGTEFIDFAKNVKASSLNYVRSEDIKVRVNIKGVGADNKATREMWAGENGGEVINLPDRLNVTDEKALTRIAQEELKRVSYTGFRGDVTLWGKPYVGAAWVVNVKDVDYADHDGFYFVKAVNVRCSINGFERKLTLAERIS